MGLALWGCPNMAGGSEDYLPSPLPCEFSQVTLGQGRLVTSAPPSDCPAGSRSCRMWPVWVLRLFSLSVTQTQSISPQTKMQLAFGVCSGTAPDGREKILCSRALGLCQDQQGHGKNSGGKTKNEGMRWAGGGEERCTLT